MPSYLLKHDEVVVLVEKDGALEQVLKERIARRSCADQEENRLQVRNGKGRR
jgi:hypothetical protein